MTEDGKCLCYPFQEKVRRKWRKAGGVGEKDSKTVVPGKGGDINCLLLMLSSLTLYLIWLDGASGTQAMKDQVLCICTAILEA